MNTIQPGTYHARIQRYEMGETDKGTPYVRVLLAVEDGGMNPSEISYFGYLTEKSAPYTLRTLLTMGFTGSDPLDLADAAKGNLLTTEELDVVIEHETYEGKTRAKVIAIYGHRPSMTPSQAKVKLGAMNLKAQLAAIKAELGIKTQAPKPAPAQPAHEPDLPF
jgi:hypothetical protein